MIDDIIMILSKSDQTDESRLDEDYLSFKLDQVGAQLKLAEYRKTNVLDRAWLQNLGKLTFHKVNFADDVNLVYATSNVSKTTLPQLLSLEAGGGNQDLALTLISTCGKKKYTRYSMSMWGDIPAEHERSLFNYYDRINTALYVNKNVDELVAWGVLACPEDAKIIQSEPVTSGSIVTATRYIVKFGQVVYNGATYQDGETFVGFGVATFAGTGKVYLDSQVRAFRASDAYPVSAEMARNMVIELLAKEYQFEMKVIPDTRNDSRDDAQKAQV